MKNILLLSFSFLFTFVFGQSFEPFNYTGSVTSNGWTTHSGTGGQLQAIVTPSNVGNSLYVTNLDASVGNRTTLVAGNSEDANKAISGITGSGYLSFLINVPNTTGINVAGDYFTGFGATSGTSVTVLGARTFIKPGLTPNTFQLGILNTSGGTVTTTYSPTEFPCGVTVFVVVKLVGTTSPIQASLWLNPTPGTAEPIADVTNAVGTGLFASFASIFMREGGSAASGTGSLELDEFRYGSNWASVTPCSTPTSYYADADNDGFGDPAVMLQACIPMVGYVTNNSDCNDNDATINPLAIDIPGNGIDEDCDGVDATAVPLMIGLYEFTAAANCPVTSNLVTVQPPNALFSPFTNMGVTCSPTANVFSASTWNQGNNIDLNQYNEFSIVADTCVALNLSSVAFNHRTSATGGAPTWILRASLDNFTTNIGSGLSGNNGNVMLDDTVALPISFSGISQVTFRIYLTNIGAAGSTWRMDNVSLYGSTTPILPQLFYADADADGFGDAAVSLLACSAPANYVSNNTDCNDLDALINPLTVWYVDADLDGFGNPNNFVTSCIQPPGTSINGLDCDDSNAQLNLVVMYYVDADTDGFGDDATGVEQCAQPANTVTIGGDCDDADSTVYPGAIELCDGLDNNCNNSIDEGFPTTTYYEDLDGDSFGSSVTTSTCETLGIGYVLITGDCDDNNPDAFPGATEILDNGIDENCDGVDNYLSLVDLNETDVLLFPNPTAGSFTLELPFSLENNKLVIRDLNGKLVFENVYNGSNISIDVSSLMNGCYILQIEAQSRIITKRLIIAK